MNPMMPTKFKLFYEEFKDKPFNLLDVGCGNHSAFITKKFFKHVRYDGVDKGTYNNSDEDFDLMDKFHLIDLSETGNLAAIPDNSYDVIIFAHVIEHLLNGLEVLAALCDKLRDNGVIYIESPSERSLTLPSVKGTLNFYDDPTHVKFHPLNEIVDVVDNKQLDIDKMGIRRDKARIILTPYIIIKSFIQHREFTSRGLWDPLGFAQFVYARKPGGKG